MKAPCDVSFQDAKEKGKLVRAKLMGEKLKEQQNGTLKIQINKSRNFFVRSFVFAGFALKT